jgi:uncharacterized protein YjdB
VPRDAAGEALPDRAVVWASADPGIAAIDRDGNVVPQATGRVQIAASSEGHSAVVELQVLPRRVRAVETVTVSALATGVDGAPIEDRTVAFSSSTPTVATVDEEGRVVARGAGSTEIVATVEGIADAVVLTVAPARPRGMRAPRRTSTSRPCRPPGSRSRRPRRRSPPARP